MATKTCPSCGADVPTAANVCKHCFHDFNEVVQKKTNPLVIMLGFLVAMAVVGAALFAHLYYNNAAERIVVDAETQSIVISRTTASGTTTDRIPFSDVQKIEHVMGGDKAMFEVVAITSDGERVIIQTSDKPLLGHAEHIAAVVDKPWEDIRTIKTFGD
ncbi:zinc ribbon domain-containing protein [Myxococcota bacterium]|nr:zinc ribbon domain-containing protein [Myxococcota bacterium]